MRVRQAMTVLAFAAVAAAGLARPADAALVAYWAFDNSGANAVAGGPVGALQAGAGFSAAQTAPVPSSTHSLLLSGSGGQEFAVSGAADRAALDAVFQGNFAISLWARSNVPASGQGVDLRYMFDFGEAHGTGVGVVFNQSHINFGGNTNTIGFYYTATGRDSGVPGLADQWYHVVLTRNGTTTTLYVDGVPRGTPIVTATPSINEAFPFVIGGEAKSANRGWNGYIDDVAVWNRALRPGEIQQLASGAAGPQDLPAVWDFRGDAFNDTQAPNPGVAVGAWIDGARWRYGTQASVTNHVYAASDISEFVDFAYWKPSQWQISSTPDYPSVRVSDGTLHPGDGANLGKDVVVAWEADFTGFVDVDYSASALSTGGVGYQMLQWDQSAGQMRVLQQRKTHSGSGAGSGPLQVRTRVEPGDRILFVMDSDGAGSADRNSYYQTVFLSDGPQLDDSWTFSGDKFNNASLADGAGPWRNSARWRYMSSSRARDYAYSSPADFADLPQFVGGNTWQVASGYPNVRISDETIHPGAEQVVVAWEADFAGFVRYEFEPSKFYSYTTVQYQLLQWDAGAGVMNVLHAREELGDNEPAVTGRTWVGIGDLLYFVVDNGTGDSGGDRVYFAATITVVPEPAAWLLAASGFVGLAALRRRRLRR